MKRTLTNCDGCGKDIPLYHGAGIGILEQCHTTRAFPHRDREDLDLCDACYNPIFNVLKKFEERRKSLASGAGD